MVEPNPPPADTSEMDRHWGMCGYIVGRSQAGNMCERHKHRLRHTLHEKRTMLLKMRCASNMFFKSCLRKDVCTFAVRAGTWFCEQMVTFCGRGYWVYWLDACRCHTWSPGVREYVTMHVWPKRWLQLQHHAFA